MQILGIGVDLVQLLRVEQLLRKHSRFPDRILGEQEAKEMPNLFTARVGYLAKRIAAKEAAVKALGIGFRGIGWRDIEIIRSDNGRPVMIFYRAAERRAHAMGVQSRLVSLSDERDYALAFVVLTK